MTITTTQVESVHVIDLGDGDNRFNRGTVDGLNAALDVIEADDSPAALVTTGRGKVYHNGLDLDWLGTGAEDSGAFVADVEQLLLRILRLDVITVAALNGHAFAGGGMLALAHDFAIMREDRGFWCLPEVDLGLPLTSTMFQVVSARLPRQTLSESILTGRRYTATEALAGGIVTETAPLDDVLPRALELASTYVGKSRMVIGEHKALLHPDR